MGAGHRARGRCPPPSDGVVPVTMRILRERHRPVWRRKAVLLAAGAVALGLGLGLGSAAWHRGGAVPVHAITVALPDRDVGG